MSFLAKLLGRQFVTVHFREVGSPERENRVGYTYRWGLRETPRVGQWVWVPGSDGLATAVIVATEVPTPGFATKDVAGVVSPEQIQHGERSHAIALAAEEQDLLVWLDMMRAKAGFHVDRWLPEKPPAGMPAIPPVRGSVIGQPAYDRGRVWMRAHHRAVERARPDEECQAFANIAHAWYARGRKQKGD